jgi:hypothetical protein
MGRAKGQSGLKEPVSDSRARLARLVEETPKLEPHGSNQYVSASGNEKGGHSERMSIKYGENSTYLVARLKRDAPKIAARLAVGEFSSVRAAAIEAGIIKVRTPMENLLKAWQKVSKEEQELFKKEFL